MKLSFIADVHVGMHRRYANVWRDSQPRAPYMDTGNARAEATLTALHRAVDTLDGTGQLIVVGDLFDYARPEAVLVGRANAALAGAERAMLLYGNHEYVGGSAENAGALAALATDADQHMVYQPRHYNVYRGGKRAAHVIAVPFVPGDMEAALHGAVAAYGQNDLARFDGTQPVVVLAFHAGVIDEHTPAFLRGSRSAIPLDSVFAAMAKCGATHAFCGDWHQHGEWRRTIDGVERVVVQVGALVPTGFDNPGLDPYGRVATLDIDTLALTYKRIPGPRFIKGHDAASVLRQLPTLTPDGVAEHVGRDALCYIEIAGANTAEAAGQVHAALVLAGVAGAFHIEARDTATPAEARAAVQAAAQAARSASRLDDAIAQYVAGIAGDDAPDVLERVKRFLADA
jgi:hypothetical protein